MPITKIPKGQLEPWNKGEYEPEMFWLSRHYLTPHVIKIAEKIMETQSAKFLAVLMFESGIPEQEIHSATDLIASLIDDSDRISNHDEVEIRLEVHHNVNKRHFDEFTGEKKELQ